MARRIIWSPLAIERLEEICNFIGKDSEYYARRFAKNINKMVKSLPEFPEAGRMVPEYQNPQLRERIFHQYRIVYRIKENTIEIAVITHGALPLPEAL